jgi:hypothetical protein
MRALSAKVRDLRVARERAVSRLAQQPGPSPAEERLTRGPRLNGALAMSTAQTQLPTRHSLRARDFKSKVDAIRYLLMRRSPRARHSPGASRPNATGGTCRTDDGRPAGAADLSAPLSTYCRPCSATPRPVTVARAPTRASQRSPTPSSRGWVALESPPALLGRRDWRLRRCQIPGGHKVERAKVQLSSQLRLARPVLARGSP